MVTPLSVAIGVAASYGLVRGRFKAAAVINALLMSPIIIPGVVTGIALMTMFNLIGSGWSFGNLVIAMTLVCLPFTVRSISANLHGLNPTRRRRPSTWGPAAGPPSAGSCCPRSGRASWGA